MLERRAIVLADGSVRSYFALPADYEFAPRHLPGPELPGPSSRFPPLGPMSPDMGDPFLRDRGQEYFNLMGKRKFGDEGEMMRDDRELAWKRQQLLQLGNAGVNPNGHPGGEFLAGPSNPRDMAGFGGGDEFRMAKQIRIGGGYQGLQVNAGPNKHNEVDQSALKKAFLHFVKFINENANLKKLYLENGKQGPLNCIACGRSARDFPDMHALIMHTYNPDRADLLVDHLGLHKAVCLLMGWNYLTAPDNLKAYQSLSAEEAAANQDDVILWPPTVVVHNTVTGKGKEGRMEGLGNKAMDTKLRELGFPSGKAKSVYGREGHMGITLVRFSADQLGLKDAVRFAEFFEREKRGRKGWARVQSSLTMGKDDENNPNLMELDKKRGEKQRILYGYLGTVFDLDKVDSDTRKKIQIETRRDYATAK